MGVVLCVVGMFNKPGGLGMGGGALGGGTLGGGLLQHTPQSQSSGMFTGLGGGGTMFQTPSSSGENSLYFNPFSPVYFNPFSHA